MKDEFICTNEIFLIFQLLVQLRHKFSISISDSLKENSILHLLLSLFFFDDEFFTREIFIFSKPNSSARMKFSLFSSYLCSWDTNSRSQFVTVWKRIQFCISNLSSSTLRKNFSLEKFSLSQSWIRLHQLNFPYFSVSPAVQTEILDLNLWQSQREFNSASSPSLLPFWGRTFYKKNFHFLKAQFVSINSIFLIFQFLVRLRPKFSIWICDIFKENSILHLLFSFIYFQDEFFIKKNFHFLKDEFVGINWIFFVFQFLLPFRPKFSIWICDTLEENSILLALLFLFYSKDQLFIRKIFILWKLNSSRHIEFSFFSVSCAVKTPILHLNLWQFQRELNTASPFFVHLLSGRIFHKKNFHFLKDEFVGIN